MFCATTEFATSGALILPLVLPTFTSLVWWIWPWMLSASILLALRAAFDLHVVGGRPSGWERDRRQPGYRGDEQFPASHHRPPRMFDHGTEPGIR